MGLTSQPGVRWSLTGGVVSKVPSPSALDRNLIRKIEIRAGHGVGYIVTNKLIYLPICLSECTMSGETSGSTLLKCLSTVDRLGVFAPGNALRRRSRTRPVQRHDTPVDRRVISCKWNLRRIPHHLVHEHISRISLPDPLMPYETGFLLPSIHAAPPFFT